MPPFPYFFIKIGENPYCFGYMIRLHLYWKDASKFNTMLIIEKLMQGLCLHLSFYFFLAIIGKYYRDPLTYFTFPKNWHSLICKIYNNNFEILFFTREKMRIKESSELSIYRFLSLYQLGTNSFEIIPLLLGSAGKNQLQEKEKDQ